MSTFAGKFLFFFGLNLKTEAPLLNVTIKKSIETQNSFGIFGAVKNQINFEYLTAACSGSSIALNFKAKANFSRFFKKNSNNSVETFFGSAVASREDFQNFFLLNTSLQKNSKIFVGSSSIFSGVSQVNGLEVGIS
jgi:phosphoenolpyruvate carboxylase